MGHGSQNMTRCHAPNGSTNIKSNKTAQNGKHTQEKNKKSNA